MIFAHLLRISCFGFVAMTLCLTGITHASNVTQTNNNGIIALQNASGDPMRAGKVKLEYYGHMAFRIITPNGLSIPQGISPHKGGYSCIHAWPL